MRNDTKTTASTQVSGLFNTPNNKRQKYLPEVLENLIFDHSDLHELIALSMTSKAYRRVILGLAEKILIRYFEERRQGYPLKVIPASFKSYPIHVASQLLSTSIFRNRANLTKRVGFRVPISFSPDGRYFVSTCSENTCRVWSQNDDGHWQSVVLREITSSELVLSFSPDGRYFVTGVYDGTCRVWSQNNDGHWQSVVLQGHTDWVTAVSFSPDGRYFVSASNDSTCRVWSKGDNGQWGSVVLQEHTNQVGAISFSPDGCYFVSGSHDKTCRVWSQGDNGLWQSVMLHVIMAVWM